VKLDWCARDKSNVDDVDVLRASEPASRERGQSAAQRNDATAPPFHTAYLSALSQRRFGSSGGTGRVDGDPDFSNRMCDDQREYRRRSIDREFYRSPKRISLIWSGGGGVQKSAALRAGGPADTAETPLTGQRLVG